MTNRSRRPAPTPRPPPRKSSLCRRRLLLLSSLAVLVVSTSGCNLAGRDRALSAGGPTSAGRPFDGASLGEPGQAEWAGVPASARPSLPPSYAASRALELVIRATQQYRGGEVGPARSALLEARRIDPACTAGYELEARIALDLGAKSQAIVALESLAAAHPQSADVQQAAGTMLILQGERRTGLLALERAVQLAPGNAAYARELAAAYVSLHNMPAAEAVLAGGMQRNTGEPTLTVAMARLCEYEGRWAPAAAYFNVAVRNDPANPTWPRQRAHCLYQLGTFERELAANEVNWNLMESNQSEREPLEPPAPNIAQIQPLPEAAPLDWPEPERSGRPQ